MGMTWEEIQAVVSEYREESDKSIMAILNTPEE